MSGIQYLIGWRYIRSRKRRFVSAVSIISILGIAVGVTVIITVLSVMNGFREEIRTKILDVLAHNTVTGFNNTVEDWKPLQKRLENYQDIIAVAPYIRTQFVAMNRSKATGVSAQGILPEVEKKASSISKYMVEGSLQSLSKGAYNVILGHGLAKQLRVKLGDSITALSTRRLATPAGTIPRMRRLEVTGIFKSGLSSFDSNAALLQIDDARALAGMKAGRISGFNLRIADLFAAPQVTRALQSELGKGYWVSDWTQRHQGFFRALEMEKLLLLIIMLLIVVVAMFNIVSMLVMVVMEKRNDIAILRTIGMLPRQVMMIFMTEGCLIGIFGNILGVMGGIILASYVEPLVAGIENITGTKFLDPSVYPITEVPSQLLASDVIIVASITFAFTVLATIYPSWRATRIQPAEVLKAA